MPTNLYQPDGGIDLDLLQRLAAATQANGPGLHPYSGPLGLNSQPDRDLGSGPVLPTSVKPREVIPAHTPVDGQDEDPGSGAKAGLRSAPVHQEGATTVSTAPMRQGKSTSQDEFDKLPDAPPQDEFDKLPDAATQLATSVSKIPQAAQVAVPTLHVGGVPAPQGSPRPLGPPNTADNGPDLDTWRKYAGYAAGLGVGGLAGLATKNPITGYLAGSTARDASNSYYDYVTHDKTPATPDLERMAIQGLSMYAGGGLGGSLAKEAGSGAVGQILARMAGSGAGSTVGGAANDFYDPSSKMSTGRSVGDFVSGALAPLLGAVKFGGEGSVIRNFLQRASGEELPTITGADMANTQQTRTDLGQVGLLSPEQQQILRTSAANGQSVLPSSLPGQDTTRAGGQKALQQILEGINAKKPAISEALGDAQTDLEGLPSPSSRLVPRGAPQGPAVPPEGSFNPDEYMRQQFLDQGRYDAGAYKQFAKAMPPGEQPPPRIAGDLLRTMDPKGEIQPKLRSDAENIQAAMTPFKPDLPSSANNIARSMGAADEARNAQLTTVRGPLEKQVGDLRSQLGDLNTQEQAAASLSSDVSLESKTGYGLGPPGRVMRIVDLLRNKLPNSSLGGLRNESPLTTESQRSFRALFPDQAQREIVQPAPGPDASTTPLNDLLSRLLMSRHGT